MGSHINKDGEFQSDKYPTCPAGKVPLSTKDLTAQDLLWEYAQRRRAVDAEFSEDLEAALAAKGYMRRSPLSSSETGLHALWGQAKESPTYDKSAWIAFQVHMQAHDAALKAANKLIGEAADEAKKLQDRIDELETDLDIVGRP